MLTRLAVSLTLTVAIEGITALLWGLRGRRELTLTVLVNCLTNPAAVLLRWVSLGLWHWSGPWPLLALEAAVVLAEWRCYRAFSRKLRRPLLFSLTANAASFGAGCLLNLLS